MSSKTHPIAQKCRAVLGLGLGIAWWATPFLNEQIQSIWNHLRENRVFRHDSLEPLVVTIGFVLSLALFYTLDLWIPSCHKWRLQKKVYAKGTWERGVKSVLSHEMIWYWTPLALFDYFFPRRSLPVLAPSVWTLLLEVLLSLILYDAFFFVFHLIFHKVPGLYEKYHARHHSLKTVRACEALKLSGVEQAVDVGCSIVAINILRAHPLSRAIYNFIIVYLITELHSGYDFPWMLQNVVPFGLWAGSVRHDYHHKHGTRYYQKFFTYLDDLYQWMTEKHPTVF